MLSNALRVAKAITAFLVAGGGYLATRPLTGDTVTDTTNLLVALGLAIAAAAAVWAVPNKAPA